MSDRMRMDVVVVGGGVAGLSCALRLAKRGGGKLSVLVMEKAAQAGGHLLSGAVMRTDGLRRLLGDADVANLPWCETVKGEAFHALLPKGSLRLPFVPPKMRMTGLPMVEISALGATLAEQAATVGVEVVTAQTVDELIWEGDAVVGVRSEGEEIGAAQVVLAEGPAGLLTADVMARHPEVRGANGQSYALGIKELVEIPPDEARAGQVVHTFGWPVPIGLYGGGFVYHLDATHVALGLALALDSHDAGLNVHDLFRRWKRHALVQSHVAGGKVTGYGARLIPEGGWYSLLHGDRVKGLRIIGDAAGWVDTMELKGLHLAVESGMAAADAILRELGGADGAATASAEEEQIPSQEGLRRTKNYRAAFRGGMPVGVGMAGLAWMTRGVLPPGRWPQREERHAPHPMPEKRRRALESAEAAGAADAGPLDLGLDSDLFCARLKYREGEPGHIELSDASACRQCLARYGAPCTRFCPAGVYARAPEGAATPILVHHENCLQCRTCTLKCPMDVLRWKTPVHGNGPDYRGM